jgi:hypothetical protein
MMPPEDLVDSGDGDVGLTLWVTCSKCWIRPTESPPFARPPSLGPHVSCPPARVNLCTTPSSLSCGAQGGRRPRMQDHSAWLLGDGGVVHGAHVGSRERCPRSSSAIGGHRMWGPDKTHPGDCCVGRCGPWRRSRIRTGLVPEHVRTIAAILNLALQRQRPSGAVDASHSTIPPGLRQGSHRMAVCHTDTRRDPCLRERIRRADVESHWPVDVQRWDRVSTARPRFRGIPERTPWYRPVSRLVRPGCR